MSVIFYSVCAVALVISFFKSKEKTFLALKKAWRSFENVLPQVLSILLIIGITLAILTPEQISYFLGSGSGWYGVLLAALIGSVTLVPVFIAFPLAGALLQHGAGYMQLAAFVSTLMMVGIITFPVEIKYFGLKATVLRNAFGLIFSLIVAAVMGAVF